MKAIPIRQISTEHAQHSIAGRFSIRSLKQLLNGDDLVHDLHKHNFFLVLAVQKGKGTHEIDFEEYQLHDHSIFILRPGQVHRLELKKSSTGFLMEFDPSFYRPQDSLSHLRWKKAIGRNYCQVPAAPFSNLQAILTNIYDEFTTKQEAYIEAIKANLDLFFIEHIRQSHNAKGAAKVENGYTQERLDELVGLIEANVATMKNVSDYADLLNLSSYQLNSITKMSVGKTVSELINEQIMLEAKRYLLATPTQVKDIANHLGYEDVSYFIRLFKKHMAQSPEAFRKNFK